MTKKLALLVLLGTFVLSTADVQAQNILSNGNLDRTYQQEIVPGFFLPKPDDWLNDGSRTLTGAYEDEMSSEPWAGPAPTPVTTDGVNGEDWAVFFKPFSGNITPPGTNGPATGHLYQDNPATPGVLYRLTGWAGAEANALMADAQFAVEFLDAGSNLIGGGSVLSLLPTLYVDNGESFDYKEYTVSATAPAGAAFVRARASMIGATGNPLGGGQAFVIDDFELVAIPEPGTFALLGAALVGVGLVHRRRK